MPPLEDIVRSVERNQALDDSACDKTGACHVDLPGNRGEPADQVAEAFLYTRRSKFRNPLSPRISISCWRCAANGIVHDIVLN